VIRLKQAPLRTASFSKRDLRTQFGALCYRVHKDETQVLLVTSRQSKRWIIPKGWPQDGVTPAQSAANEAFEEAGVTGKSINLCLGMYSYTKIMDEDQDDLPCAVSVFPIKVKKLLDKYPEVKMRKRRWFNLKKAAGLVKEPELRKILKHFDYTLLEQ
jgi:8-oxo-dGTP pyrophosphatase MutT (NUDIX family)